MAVCTYCDGEGTRLGRYAGIAGSETPTVRCEECCGLGYWEDEDDEADRIDDVRLNEQREGEV